VRVSRNSPSRSRICTILKVQRRRRDGEVPDRPSRLARSPVTLKMSASAADRLPCVRFVVLVEVSLAVVVH
jgi:hypothetical protein